MPKKTFVRKLEEIFLQADSCLQGGVMYLGQSQKLNPKKGETIETREGKLIAVAGEDFIIRGVEGEIYPISKEIFYKTYEVLEQ